MESSNLFLTITPDPLLSLILLVSLLLMAMYLARKPFHRAVAALGRMVYNTMRMAAASVRLAEGRLIERNREILMAHGLDMAERRIERDFDRIGNAVQKNMEGYPQLGRKISEDLHRLEEDYQKCSEIPQCLPDWVKVIDAIAHIRPNGDRMVLNMLEEIHTTLTDQHKTALERHRRDVAERHHLLSRMQPLWRGMHKVIAGVEKSMGELNQYCKRIDRCMDAYQKIRIQTDFAERRLQSSALTRFFVSGLLLALAAVGAVVNFSLIALPLSEMVGGATFFKTVEMAHVMGAFLVGAQMAVGVFLMDTLRVTRFFSMIGNLEPHKRRLIFWILLVLLVLLASLESSLAFWRDRITLEMEALRQSLSGVENSVAVSGSMPLIGQMLMGFILPFLLAFVAIPLETFVLSARTIGGRFAVLCLRALAFLLRMIGHLGFYLARLISSLYDLVIFPGILLENLAARKMSKKSNESTRGSQAACKAQECVAELIEEAVPCNEAHER